MGPCAHHRHQQQPNVSKHVSFCNFAVVTHFEPTRFYKQTTLRTETFTLTNFYAQTLYITQRRSCKLRFLYADAFTHRNFHAKKKYTKKITHRCFAQRCFCTQKYRIIKAHRRFYIQNLLHGKPLHKETFTQKNIDTEKLVHTDCAKKQLHTETFARKNITQKRLRTTFSHFFSAQKPFCTETFMHRNLYICTAVFTQMHLHTNT